MNKIQHQCTNYEQKVKFLGAAVFHLMSTSLKVVSMAQVF